MAQLSIDSFFGVKSLHIFRLYKKGGTKWESSLRKKSTIIKQILRPRLLTFTSDIEVINLSSIGNKIEDRSFCSVLISNLQKAIRRNLPDIATATAATLMRYKGGVILLLRRLCIIILEDKLACYKHIADHYDTLVWMTATEKGWKGWQQWIFGFIHYICDKDFAYFPHKEEIKCDWPTNPYACSLLVRASYGGMKCDIRMLKHYARIIEKQNHTLQKSIILTERAPIANLTILPAAIDFHCVPGIIKHIIRKYPEYRYNDVRGAIWNYSSAIRYNCQLKKENRTWRDIKKDTLSFQKWYISTLEVPLYKN